MEKHKSKNKRAHENKYLICISANVSIYHPRSSLVLIKTEPRLCVASLIEI